MRKKEILSPLILRFSNEPAKKYNLSTELGEKIYRIYWNQIFKEISKYESQNIKVEGFGSFMTTIRKINRFKNTYYNNILKSELEAVQGIEITEEHANRIDSLLNKVDNLTKLADDIQKRIDHQTKLREETRLKKGYKKPIKNNDKKIFNNDNPFE
jgi:hypothetical protein